MNIKRVLIPVMCSILPLGLTACSVAGVSLDLSKQQTVSASGTIDTDSIRVAPELAGKVKKIDVAKGDTVKAGDPLFELDDALLQAKYDEVKAQNQQATAALDVAKQNLEGAKSQYQTALDANRAQAGQVEANRWKEAVLKSINLPNWYFQKSETISSLQAEIDAAQTALDEEQKSLQSTLDKTSNKDFVDAETRVSRAQVAFEVASRTLEQAKAGVGDGNGPLTAAAQKINDQAQTELDASQQAYNAMLTGTSANDVKEARARVAAARARLENAQDAYNALLTRDDSRQVETAKIAVEIAEKAAAQAQANVTAAQAAQHEVEVQLAKMTVSAPAAGIILSKPVKEGEVVAAGSTVCEVGALDQVKLTVYVTEDQFGKVKLGDAASVKVDSFPNDTFDGKVVYIANEAEYTPRNVQTAESRSSTVYAVEIQLPNPDLKLKPGMPADATIK